MPRVRLRRYSALLLLGLFSLPPTSCVASNAIVEDEPDAGPGETRFAPGDLCFEPSPSQVRVRFEPSSIAVARCASGEACAERTVKLVVEPDFCSPRSIEFTTSDGAIVKAPASSSVDFKQPSIALTVAAKDRVGTASIEARTKFDDGSEAKATLAVDVLEPALAVCSGRVTKTGLSGGQQLAGSEGLAGASISFPERADLPDGGSFVWSIAPFDAEIACAEDLKMEGYIPLGPAITFGPTSKSFPREIPLSVPFNPARLPAAARYRHVRLAYASPRFPQPRTVPVADPRPEKIDGQWRFTFKAPRLGTYQLVVKGDAGRRTHKRRLTHRAVIGISMGGSGTAMMGFRHHRLFDVVAPLGGPVDWTWQLHYADTNHFAGFRPIASGTQLDDIDLAEAPCSNDRDCKADETCLVAGPSSQKKCVLLPAPSEPYEHAQTYDHWWYEYPRTGTGSSFNRREYVQLFRDLSLMFGNPIGENLSLGGEHLPAGVPPDDPSQTGGHPNGECKVWLDPLSGPDEAKQQQIASTCPIDRCAHPLTLHDYFDAEYNPDGTFPVITFCDGSPQNEALTPYANTWTPDGNDHPVEMALAVDYNGNGVRDELEPVILSSYETWNDFGEDDTPSELEAGYAPGVNEDPAGDDYDAQYNPAGTEGDHRHQDGESFEDSGLDGVFGTKQQPAYPAGYQKPGDGYDVGEGDGMFTVARGRAKFWDRDPRSIVRGMTSDLPAGPLTDEALARVDLWTDGGTRDLFNFAIAARHLAGSLVSRGRDAAYFTGFTQVPGLDPTKPNEFFPSRVVYDDLQGVVFSRYGNTEPTDIDIENGSGQHVGSANELASRLQGALYFIGSRWREPDLRTLVAESADKPVKGAADCEIVGNCDFEFTSSFGRTGPVTVSLPVGYAHAEQQWRRYPVIYMLHGYGQTPQDLGAAIVLLRNWMNSPTDSVATRLPKAILVYVDGRCRVGKEGQPECIQGSFFTDSVRATGIQNEAWWLELMDYVDQHYRTMGETEVDWTD